MISVNTEPDMRESFHQAIRENPLDPATRMIYGDWLDENNHPEEAEQHRRMGRVMMEGFEGKGQWGREAGRGQLGFLDPSIHYATRRGKVVTRPATPLEASVTAYRNSLVPLLAGKGVNPHISRAKTAARTAVRYARSGHIGSRENAVEAHERAAAHYMDAAEAFEKNPQLSGEYVNRLRRSHDLTFFRHQRLGTPAPFGATLAAMEKSGIANSPESHRIAAESHKSAKEANSYIARSFGSSESGNPYSSLTRSDFGIMALQHGIMQRAHEDAANANGNRYRLAAYGHLIAAQMHREG